MKTNPIEKALEKKHPIQTSKEYVNGKWQKADFFEDKKGKVTVKPRTNREFKSKLEKEGWKRFRKKYPDNSYIRKQKDKPEGYTL